GCIPAELADTPIDYESLQAAGAIMGSGGLVVMVDRDCMVDVARFFLEFTQRESCGKCTFCRIGTRRMLDILDALCTGQAKHGDLEKLESLARQVKQGSLCGLGQTAPNPFLTTLRYFGEEYEAHLEGRCPAGKCKALIAYGINDNCFGCTKCAQHCPGEAIALKPYERHIIDQRKCLRCGTCREICRHDAVMVE
ncbi:MAG: NADH-ubiquinone oxidoreductase-F iron-sulfur binding region domain-containing protein, partial [Armatimonadia bacterium]